MVFWSSNFRENTFLFRMTWDQFEMKMDNSSGIL